MNQLMINPATIRMMMAAAAAFMPGKSAPPPPVAHKGHRHKKTGSGRGRGGTDRGLYRPFQGAKSRMRAFAHGLVTARALSIDNPAKFRNANGSPQAARW